MTAFGAPGPSSRSGGRHRLWHWGRYGIGAALAALALWAVAGKTGELSGSAHYLEHLRWGWVILAAIAEALSFVCYAAIQHRLLAAAQVTVRMRPLTGITLAGNAIQNSLPAGVLLSAAYSYRQYRRLGADEISSAWVLVATTAVSFLSLATLAATGLALAFGSGSALGLVEVIIGIFAFAALIVLGWTQRRWASNRAAGLIRISQRLVHRPVGDADAMIGLALDRLGTISPDRSDWAWAMLWAFGNWVTDLGCLALAFQAIGSDIPWQALLLAYAAGQLATNLPVTPGGLGVVEGSLTVALVVFGGSEDSIVAAVLVYRLFSFWLLLPAGWGAWGIMALDARRRGTNQPRSPKPIADGAPA